MNFYEEYILASKAITSTVVFDVLDFLYHIKAFSVYVELHYLFKNINIYTMV